MVTAKHTWGVAVSATDPPANRFFQMGRAYSYARPFLLRSVGQ
jgi:hypothetical protein